MYSFLPNLAALESVLLRKEALLSCQIDGIKVPIYDLLDASRKPNNKTVSVINYISALQLGLNQIKKSSYKNTLLCDIHDIISGGNENGNRSEFRKAYKVSGRVMVVTNRAPLYYPTAPEHFPIVLNDLEAFICRVDELDVILKTALVHYQLQTISPFISANGLLARILTYLMLANKNIQTCPLFCLSYYLSLNKMEYKDRIETLHHKCDYGQWIRFFVKSVIFAVNDSIERIKSWLQIRENNLHKIEAHGKTVKAINPFYEAIERFPIFDINTVAQATGVSYNTGASALRILSDLGIVKQTNQVTRNRDYAYLNFLNCFFDKDMLHIQTTER